MPDVRLRPVAPADLDTLFAHYRDPEAGRVAAFTHKDPSDRAAFDAHWAKLFADESIRKRVVVADGAVVGNILCWGAPEEREVTYWIDRAHWGKGLATFALAALVVEETARPLFGRTAKDNVGSRRVLEKCGFRLVGEGKWYAHARGAEIDEILLRLDEPVEVSIRPWAERDLPLLERISGDPAMTTHLGGPETPDQIRARHERYLRTSTDAGRMFVIVAGAVAVGSAGYWETEWNGGTVYEAGWSVLPEFQGRGLAARGTAQAIARARQDGRRRFLHAFPKVENAPSQAICRKLGFTRVGECGFEYPKGNPIRCVDWRMDLRA
jgi:RimJ/RimL family protein N-acetyltransferase